MIRLLVLCARHARALLVWGLVAGVAGGLAAPDAVAAMHPAIAPMVVSLLALAVMRLGPAGMRAGLRDLRRAALLIAVLQLAMPLALALAARALGWDGPFVLGLIVMLAAAPIIGAPSLALICGADPAPALRLLVMGTATLPLTALPVFALIPAFGDPWAVVATVARLGLLIVLAGALGLAARRILGDAPRTLQAVEGTSALILAAVVVALMGAAGPALLTLGGWVMLAALMAINLALQIGAGALAHRAGDEAMPYGITAGNRNIALFLGALPAGIATDLVAFIGLYQIPMYLTPVLLPWVYSRLGLSPTASRQ